MRNPVCFIWKRNRITGVQSTPGSSWVPCEISHTRPDLYLGLPQISEGMVPNSTPLTATDSPPELVCEGGGPENYALLYCKDSDALDRQRAYLKLVRHASNLCALLTNVAVGLALQFQPQRVFASSAVRWTFIDCGAELNTSLLTARASASHGP